MRRPAHHAVRIAAAVILVLGLSDAWRQSASAQAAPAALSQTIDTTATVETVDHKTRQVLLRRADGSYLTMIAPAEVRNFSQIKPGDLVHARYQSALVARIGQPGHRLMSDGVLEASDRAPKGAKPGVFYGLVRRRSVRIMRVDAADNLVSFIGPAGIEQTVFVRTAPMRAFLATLKPGDDVDVTYREATLVEVVAPR